MSKALSRPPNFTRKELRELIYYDMSTGVWTWRVERNHLAKAGDTAGCLNASDGRFYIKVFSQKYAASRLAWFYMKGTWPKKDVEHRDGDKTNNKWSNLRLATRTENQGNARARVSLKGVTRVRTGKYTAQIQKHMVKMHLGTFDTAEEAHAAYVRKAIELYGEFARAA